MSLNIQHGISVEEQEKIMESVVEIMKSETSIENLIERAFPDIKDPVIKYRIGLLLILFMAKSNDIKLTAKK